VRRVVDKLIGRIGGNQGDAVGMQPLPSRFLHDQIASEAIGGLDNDAAGARGARRSSSGRSICGISAFLPPMSIRAGATGGFAS
jgi:hypothetical protein